MKSAKKRQITFLFEVCMWLTTLFLISIFAFFTHLKIIKEQNTYHIFMHDVDGLIKGSPVRLLGVQIGYVSRISLVDEEIYLSFLVTQKNCKIPKGSTATVGFTGLAGSKSLEIFPPDQKSTPNTENITVLQTKRLGDFIEMGKKYADLALQIQEGLAKIRVEDISAFQKNIIKANIAPFSNLIDNVDKFEKDYNEKIKITNKKLQDVEKNVDPEPIDKEGVVESIKNLEVELDKLNEITQKISPQK